MPISTKEFEERGRASPFLNSAEDVVARDLRSRGWGAELAKDMGPAGEPDLKAQKAAQAIS